MKKTLIVVLILLIPLMGVICFAVGFAGYMYIKSKGDNGKEITEEIDLEEGEAEDENTSTDSTNGTGNSTDDVIPDSGIITNELYGFTIDVGDASKYTVEDEIVDWAVGWFVYCYELEEETDYEDMTCGTGKVGLFNIAVYSEDQYDEILASPFADTYPLLGTQNGLYFMLEWPNGDLPEEVPDLGQLYSQVETSFMMRE